VPSPVGGMNPANYICMSPTFNGCASQGNTSPLLDLADTLSWTKGKHAFKGGVDIRKGHSNGWASPTAPIPQSQGGAGQNPVQAFQNATNFPNFVSTNQTLANQLLYFLAGSVNTAQQVYFLKNSKDLTKWENYKTVDHKYIDVRQNEFDVFFKDDWKVRPSLTLNLGLRYEYYGVPFENHGLATAPIGGGIALFGVSGRNFDRWMRPDNGVDLSLVTTSEFVGPNTVNPGKSLYKNDWNNFGPAVGFAWQLPWFGKGKTNIRGGYQMTYSGGGRAQPIDNFVLSNPGFQNIPSIQTPPDGSYFDLRNLPSVVPIPPSTLPMQPIPVQKQNQNAAAFDYNYETPYVQNFTLSVTRDVRRNLNVDVRYIATRGLKLQSGGVASFDLNSPDVFYNPVLFDALVRTRRGEDVELFDQMLLGLNINSGVNGCIAAQPTTPCAAVNGTTQRGSAHLRLNSTFRTALANGDFAAAASALNTYNGSGAVGVGAVASAGGERGTVLRRANKGFNVPGGTAVAGTTLVVPAGVFPENWIVANPQFNQAQYFTNSGSSIYHSVQVQTTIRQTHGMSFQGTYVWSKGLGISPSSYTNPTEREKEYILGASHRTHDFRGNGIFELPVGPNKLLFANSSGWLARAVERWQTGVIININSGAPTSITAGNMLYANGVADVVGPFNMRQGSVHWGDPGSNQLVGGYFDTGVFGKTSDPQCAAVADSLKAFCTLQAVTDAKTGQIVLQNPQPGRRGTLGRQTLELPGAWTFDANLSKRFRITESKEVQVRFDAQNVLNHPNPNAPTLSINSTNAFGLISGKTNDHRQFQGQLRLTF
jgi:hypothetical protein